MIIQFMLAPFGSTMMFPVSWPSSRSCRRADQEYLIRLVRIYFFRYFKPP